MTENNTTENKAPVKKTVPKKAVTKPATATTKDETPVKEVTQRKKRVEIERNEMIPCRSTVNGELIYISNRTGAKFIWEDFGATLWLEMGDLQDMNGSNRAYIHDGYIVVDDEEASESLGLTKVYEKIAHIDNIENLFAKSAEDLLETLPKLPKGMRDSLSTKARAMVEDGSLDSLSKIRAIESVLGVDLEGFAKK
jgi:hypothetical protein